MRARSATPLAAGVPLRGARRDGEWLRADYVGRHPAARTHTALLELSSALGGVTIQIQPRTGSPELQ